jgi:hypothetical protein
MKTKKPVSVDVPLDHLVALMKAAAEAAEELAELANERYPSRHDQPVQMRRFRRDTESAQSIVSAIEAMPEPARNALEAEMARKV